MAQVLAIGAGAYLLNEAFTPLFDGLAAVASSIDNKITNLKIKWAYWRKSKAMKNSNLINAKVLRL